MKPEDIRRLYRQEGAATEEEAQTTFEAIRTDPELARNHIAVLQALAEGGDRDVALLLSAFIAHASIALITERMAQDDAYALRCGAIVVDLMERMKPGSTPRGKPGKTKMA